MLDFMELVKWVLLGLATVSAVYYLCWRCARPMYHLTSHPNADELLETSSESPMFDGLEPLEADPNQVDPTRKVVGGTRFRKWMVAMLRAKVGYHKRSEANRLMVDKVVRDLLAEHRVRPTQWHLHMPVITAMYFIPSDAEIEARSLLGAGEAHRRDYIHTRGDVGFTNNWSWWWKQPLGYTK